MRTKARIACQKCGLPVRQDEKRIGFNREVYRKYSCINRTCGYEFFTIEYEVEDNEQFLKEWKEL